MFIPRFYDLVSIESLRYGNFITSQNTCTHGFRPARRVRHLEDVRGRAERLGAIEAEVAPLEVLVLLGADRRHHLGEYSHG